MYRSGPVEAADKLRRNCIALLPINVVEIARQLGIEVVYVDLPSNKPGFMNEDPPGSFTIWLNRNDCHERRNWTCAHELGHWCMHRHMQKRFASTPGSRRLSEREANLFAAELLMPESVVKELAPKMSFGGLASYFEASLQAMDLRLQELDVECGL